MYVYMQQTRNDPPTTMIMTQFRRKKPKKYIKIGSGSLVLVIFLLMMGLFSGESQLLQTQLGRSKLAKHSNVTRLNDEYQTVDDILQWICKRVSSEDLRIIDLTNWGPSSLVILHKLEQLQRLQRCPPIPVVTIDTLHLFPETYAFLESKKKKLGQNLLIVKPKKCKTAEGFDRRYGPNLAVEHPQQYAYWSKVEPMYRALQGLHADAWITGRRRSQGGERTNLKAFELDTINRNTKLQRLKINPLVDWTYDQVWEYIRDNEIPYNPLYDQGYKSLGDVRTTSKVEEGQGERAGRFQGMNQTECGIHNLPMLSSSAEEGMKPKLQTFVELSADTLDEVVLNQDTSQYRYEKDNVLIVFYHPQCGHCIRFEPSFLQLADEIADATESAILSKVLATRFNTGRYKVPEKKLKDVGIEVLGTPAVYLVKHKPSPMKVVEYKGIKNKIPLLIWLRKQLGEVEKTSSLVDDSKNLTKKG